MSPEMLADLRAITPEIWLVGAILACLVADLVFGKRGWGGTFTGLIALAGVGGALWGLGPFREVLAGLLGNVGVPWGTVPGVPDHPFRVMGLLSLDGHASMFRTIIISGTGLVILHAMVFRGIERATRGEFFPIVLGAALGGCFLVATDHLLMLLLAMEMLSLPSYLLAGWQKKERRSSEAALKYLVYGALASALMVFGFSLMYGMSGSLWMPEVGAALVTSWEFGGSAQQLAVVLSTLLVLAGLGFKVALFPFHFWAPDVYEGSPTPVTTLLAVVSKAAGFGLLVRFVDGVFLGDLAVSGDWLARVSWIVAVLSAVTMTYGNVTAVLQRNVKRMLAYSSIAHAGYLLMGVAVMTNSAEPDSVARSAGIESLVFYLVTYYVATLGAFGCAMALANRFGAEDTDDYRGLGWSSPWICGAFVVFLVSLTGLPPTIGFAGKWLLFRATLETGLYWLAVVAALNAVVALFYYFKIARALFLRGDTEVVPGLAWRGVMPWLAKASLIALAIAAVWYGIMWDGLIGWVDATLL
ncbi:MAG: NADH-quinone oxidoreductase subunit N [Planctomycetota bacterium]|jgi:NADH-quinone oxidoreductase subunit N